MGMDNVGCYVLVWALVLTGWGGQDYYCEQLQMRGVANVLW